MADESQTAPFAFTCEGGLIKSRSTFIMQPGQALELLNSFIITLGIVRLVVE